MKKRTALSKRAATIARREALAENILLDLSKQSGIPIFELLSDAIFGKSERKKHATKTKKSVPKKSSKVKKTLTVKALPIRKIYAREPTTGRFKKSPKTESEIEVQEGYRVTSIFEEPIGENEPIEFGNFDGPEQDTNDYFDKWFDDLDVDPDEQDTDIDYEVQ